MPCWRHYPVRADGCPFAGRSVPSAALPQALIVIGRSWRCCPIRNFRQLRDAPGKRLYNSVYRQHDALQSCQTRKRAVRKVCFFEVLTRGLAETLKTLSNSSKSCATIQGFADCSGVDLEAKSFWVRSLKINSR